MKGPHPFQTEALTIDRAQRLAECHDPIKSAQLEELQGMPLPGPLPSDSLLSTDAMLGLQAQVTSHLMLP